MIQLYMGQVHNGKWFNHTEIEEIKGGSLAVLDSEDRSGSARLFNLVNSAVKSLYSAENEKYEMSPKDYEDLKVEDCWKVAMEVMKAFRGTPYPVIEEYFHCPICSRSGRDRYTQIAESWHKLIEDGIVDENYAERKDPSWWTTLPRGIEIQGTKSFPGGTFRRIRRESITIGELIRIQNTPSLTSNESNLINAVWDCEIKEIEGMNEKDLNIYVKRNIKDGFCKKYLIHQEDIETMAAEGTKYGLDATNREVRCKYCHHDIGGYLDFTNFFSFLFPKRSGRGRKGLVMSA